MRALGSPRGLRPRRRAQEDRERRDHRRPRRPVRRPPRFRGSSWAFLRHFLRLLLDFFFLQAASAASRWPVGLGGSKVWMGVTGGGAGFNVVKSLPVAIGSSKP